MNARHGHGQVLVLFALMLVALLGFAALVVDVSGAWTAIRFERATADAAALAGASDMYRDGSTEVGEPEWQRGRTHAMQNLVDALDPSWEPGGTLPTCGGTAPPYAHDVTNCRVGGTRWYVSIQAPAPSCSTGGCDPRRSLQVTVRDPAHDLTLARIFGQSRWNLAATSVAERNRGTNYSFVALRPPKPNRNNHSYCYPDCDANEDDISLDGTNTVLRVIGDMGTNTNLVLTNGATVTLSDPGSVVDRYDAYQAWSGSPPGRQVPQAIPDPDYPIPGPGAPPVGATVFTRAVDAQMTALECKAEIARIPAGYSSPTTGLHVAVTAAGADDGSVVCLKPGRYTYSGGIGGYTAAVRTLIFAPGTYFLDKGLHPGNNLQVLGGYEPGAPGVALVFPANCHPGCEFSGNALDALVLNAGSAYPTGTGVRAAAALNWDGVPVETSGRVPLPMTLIVARNPACHVAPTDPCNVNPSQYRQLDLPGGSNTFVFGVQYAPTDNVKITGHSGADGYFGQIWAWTVTYSGNSVINLVGADNPEPGVLRLATPCSPAAPCTNSEAIAPLP